MKRSRSACGTAPSNASATRLRQQESALRISSIDDASAQGSDLITSPFLNTIRDGIAGA